ncbi:MAG: TonB-dependent receptor [Tepidisphaeraceae bacterium]|jgi:iron complex outermembrane receptor protein
MNYPPMRRKFAVLQALLIAAIAATLPGQVRASATTKPSAATKPSEVFRPSSIGGDLTGLSLEDLMNVQVTSVAKEPQRIADAPAAVTVIGQDDIQRSELGSIPDLLRLVPGMDVAQINSGHWAISSRGFNGLLADDLLVLMDGRSVYTPAFGGVTWNSVNYPLMDLDRIEVIRGPGSTLWGSNAVNGVVNIITKSSKDTQGLLVDTRGGSQQDVGNIRYGGQIGDDTYYRVYTQYQYTGNGVLSDGDPAHDEWQGMQSGFRVDRYASTEDTLTLQGDVYEQQLAETTQPFPFTEDTSYYANGGNLLGRWTHTESDRADTSILAYYDRQVLSNPQPIGYEQDSFDIELQNRFPIEQLQDVTWGLGARDHFIRLDSSAFVTASPIYTNEFIYNGFVQDQVSIVPNRLQWYVGTKLEYNSLTYFDVQPSTRLLWTPDEKNSVWAAFSRSVRVPSIYEETHLNLPGYQVGTQDPDAETTESFEIGYKVQPLKPLTMDITGFYNIYSDLIVPVPNPLSQTEVDYANAADAHSYGGEASVNWQVNPKWRVGASYSFLQVDAHPIIRSPIDLFIPPYEIQYLSGSSPENQFQIHSYLDLLKNLQFNASLYYVDSLPLINGVLYGGNYQSVNSYFRLDMNLRWQINPNMTLAVGVQNLLQNRHFESGSIDAQSEPSEVPRTVFAEWTMTY